MLYQKYFSRQNNYLHFWLIIGTLSKCALAYKFLTVTCSKSCFVRLSEQINNELRFLVKIIRLKIRPGVSFLYFQTDELLCDHNSNSF
jgi:hypothetical protein